MVPKGIILDCLCVLLGTNLGSAIKNHPRGSTSR